MNGLIPDDCPDESIIDILVAQFPLHCGEGVNLNMNECECFINACHSFSFAAKHNALSFHVKTWVLRISSKLMCVQR